MLSGFRILELKSAGRVGEGLYTGPVLEIGRALHLKGLIDPALDLKAARLLRNQPWGVRLWLRSGLVQRW